MTYTVDWMDHKASSNRLQSKIFVGGDKFVMRYNSNKPEEYIVDCDEPLFVEGDDYDSCVAVVCDVSSSYSFEDDYSNTMSFKYSVYNKEFRRYQFFYSGNPGLNYTKAGDSIMVYFWMKNPQRSLLALGRTSK